MESFEVKPDLQELYTVKAREQGKTISAFIRGAIEAKLRDLELPGRDIITLPSVDEQGIKTPYPLRAWIHGYFLDIENFLVRNPELVNSVLSRIAQGWKFTKPKQRKGLRKKRGKRHKNRG